jgi:hypothetical protein
VNYSGRNKQELQELENAIQRWNATVPQINEAISTKASEYVKQHYLSHALNWPMPSSKRLRWSINALLTSNDKHYKVIQDITIDISIRNISVCRRRICPFCLALSGFAVFSKGSRRNSGGRKFVSVDR